MKDRPVLTLADIAARCGVSASTVSRVLNNAPGISGDVRQKVIESLQGHDFSHRRRKRHLSRTQLRILIVIPDTDQTSANPFFAMTELMSSINSVFDGDWKTVEVTGYNGLSEKMLKKDIYADGVIFAFGSARKALLEMLDLKEIPYVFLNRTEGNYVSCNNFKGMLKLAGFLISKGKKSIGYLGYPDNPVNNDRLRGYSSAMMESGLFNSAFIRNVKGIDGISDADARFYLKKCDAVMCFNDNFAIRLISEINRLGKTVPGDISITGFDDSPMRKLFRPLITTVSLSTYEMGFYAARWLKDNIVNKTNRTLRLEVEGELIEGETVE
jgi:DNA-binding LacI/PurR family transcriptional regulator